MTRAWESEEYSHGYFLPLISLFLIWQQKDRLERLRFDGAWLGVLVVGFGLFVFIAGELATLYTVIQYGFLVVLYGLALALLGWRGFKLIAIPLFILFFMVPLPAFLYNNLSAKLQLISSEWGVWFIRQFGISVFLDGNVIDLGEMKLQVAEACNGLRYLFPLTSIGFIVAYFYKGAMWKRVLVFLSTIPITILMNSFRIGAIGVTVEYWGEEMAEGFLHDFEGWVVFMASFGLLFILMWLLTLVGDERRPFREVFGLEFPDPTPDDAQIRYRRLSPPFVASLGLIAAMALATVVLPERQELIPERQAFAEFPTQIGEWRGRGDRLEQIFIDALQFDDYIISDYRKPGADTVNFYVAYYGSQRKGQSAHSPRSCIPGGGWRIKDLRQVTIPGASFAGKPLRVNRTQIQKGDYKQLVYYWFQQRGRIITNEYLVKVFLFWDAVTKNRTDGALVRLTVNLAPGEDWSTADEHLVDFVRSLQGHLEPFVPD
jgi:exosortase D (VPLPA-CTERM-specific)